MNKKKLLIRAYIVLLVIGIAFAVVPTDWSSPKQIIAFGATFLGFILAGISLIIPNVYPHTINLEDWKEREDGGYYYIILAKTHGMGKTPRFSGCFEEDKDEFYNAGLVDNSYNKKGDVKISVGRPYALKVLIS